MNNTTKMLLPVTALCIYCSGCVAYEQPVYHRTPTYVTPASTTYVTEPAYVAPVTYSTTTYVAEPVYIDHGYRHHSIGHVPLHGKYGSGPRHSPHHPPHGPHISTPTPQKAAIHSSHSVQSSAVHSSHSAQKAAVHSFHSVQKAAVHSSHSAQKAAAHSARSAQKAAAKAFKHH